MPTFPISPKAQRDIEAMHAEMREDIALGSDPIESEARAHQRHRRSIETEIVGQLELASILGKDDI